MPLDTTYGKFKVRNTTTTSTTTFAIIIISKQQQQQQQEANFIHRNRTPNVLKLSGHICIIRGTMAW
jgi:hypothetical protein